MHFWKSACSLCNVREDQRAGFPLVASRSRLIRNKRCTWAYHDVYYIDLLFNILETIHFLDSIFIVYTIIPIFTLFLSGTIYSFYSWTILTTFWIVSGVWNGIIIILFIAIFRTSHFVVVTGLDKQAEDVTLRTWFNDLAIFHNADFQKHDFIKWIWCMAHLEFKEDLKVQTTQSQLQKRTSYLAWNTCKQHKSGISPIKVLYVIWFDEK